MVRRVQSDASLLLLPPIAGATPASAPAASAVTFAAPAPAPAPAQAAADAFDERSAGLIAYQNRKFNKAIVKLIN